MVTALFLESLWQEYNGTVASTSGAENKKASYELAQKHKERTKVPEKFVNSVNSIPHMAAEVLLGSSTMGDTA